MKIVYSAPIIIDTGKLSPAIGEVIDSVNSFMPLGSPQMRMETTVAHVTLTLSSEPTAEALQHAHGLMEAEVVKSYAKFGGRLGQFERIL